MSGTHGKTTGTAMVVAALRALGRDPSFMVGGQLVDLNTNAHRGEPGLFVLEADEAFGTILDLHLAALAVTNIEADHLDYYGTAAAVEEAFATVAARVQRPGGGLPRRPRGSPAGGARARGHRLRARPGGLVACHRGGPRAGGGVLHPAARRRPRWR